MSRWQCVAALLASSGLYGVLACRTVRRRSGIAIRLALGASRGQIMQLVLKEAVLLVSIRLVTGLLGSLAVAQAPDVIAL